MEEALKDKPLLPHLFDVFGYITTIIVGCRNKTELRKTERFLQRFQVLRLNEQISDTAIHLLRQYRLSHRLAIPDALIAATALTLNQDFITKNQRDYRFISGLRLLPYPSASKS